MTKRFSWILMTFVLLSCSGGDNEAPAPEFFIEKTDRFLKKYFPGDYEWYLRNKTQEVTLDSVLVNDSLSLSNDELFLGSFSYYPLPIWCELYSANLKGSEEKEYLITISPAPLLSGGGVTYLLFFDDAAHQNRPLDTFVVSTSKNSFGMDFIHLTSKKYFDMAVYSDINLSVYDNAAARILQLDTNSVKEIFMQTTRFVDHLSDTLSMEAAQLIFKDVNRDSIREIVVRHVRSAGVPGPEIKMETVSKNETIYTWDQKLKKFRK